jgi:Glycosyl transferase family 2
MSDDVRAARTAPRVTVLMTVFNGERHLREAIDSVLGQSFGDFELLVVDDGSTDGTAGVLGAITDPRVRITRNATNIGLTRSLNSGLALARGMLIARHDADDVSEPDRLARQVAFLDANPDVALVGAAYRKIDERGAVLGDRMLPVDYDRIRWVLHFYCPFVHSAVVFRAAVVRAMGDYDDAFVYAQDYDLWSRLAVAHRVANLPDSLVRYRMGTTTLTATIGDQSGEVVHIAARNIESLGLPVPSAATLSAMSALIRGDASALMPTDFVTTLDGVLAVLDRLCASSPQMLADPDRLKHDVARTIAATLKQHARRLSDGDYRRALDRLSLTAPLVARTLPGSRRMAALRGRLDRVRIRRAMPPKP